MIDSQDCKAMYVYIMYSLVLQNQLYHIMFCEDQTYADFASVDRFIKSHITILAIRQKLDPQSFMLIWLVLKVQNIPTVVVLNTTPAKSVKFDYSHNHGILQYWGLAD